GKVDRRVSTQRSKSRTQKQRRMQLMTRVVPSDNVQKSSRPTNLWSSTRMTSRISLKPWVRNMDWIQGSTESERTLRKVRRVCRLQRKIPRHCFTIFSTTIKSIHTTLGTKLSKTDVSYKTIAMWPCQT